MNQQTIERFMRENEWARRTRNKNKMLAMLAEGRTMNADLITSILNADRYVRMTKKDHPELDADSKEERTRVEQNYEQSLGYVYGFDEDIKKLKTLF